MNHFTKNTLMIIPSMIHKSRHVSRPILADQQSKLDEISERFFRDAFVGYGSRTQDMGGSFRVRMFRRR